MGEFQAGPFEDSRKSEDSENTPYQVSLPNDRVWVNSTTRMSRGDTGLRKPNNHKMISKLKKQAK